MIFKMYQILNFPTFFDKIKNEKLPFKTSYKLALLTNEMEKHISFYQEKFQELIQEYSQKDENGNPKYSENGMNILLIHETEEEAYERINELRDIEVELPNITFTPEEFDKLELTVFEMTIILPFMQN